MRPLVETDATGNLRFPSNKGNPWFHKRRQLLIGVHDETLSVTMCVNNPVNVSRRMCANHGANPKGSKEGRRMNDTQTLILIHTVAWPILIWALSKTWSSSRNAVRFSST